MGFAANAITDVVAPPAPPRSSNASADDASAPSFQDHVDANDDRPQRQDQHAKNATRAASRSTPSSTEQTSPRSDTAQEDTKPDTDAHAAPIEPPVLLQLIAKVAPAVLGAKTEQPAVAKQEATAASEAQSTGADPAAALAAATTAPNTTAPKSDIAPRTPQTKFAKGATGKTTAVADDAKAVATQTTTPTPQEAAAPVAATPNVAPAILDGSAKNEDGAKTQAVDAAQSGPMRSTPPTASRPQPPATPAAVTPDLTALRRQADVAQATDHENPRASAPIEALKQAAQDLAPAAPKVQAAPSTPPPAVTHAQLAEPVQQAASDASVARAPPAAAQVGGEIIRRFNGHDTSFQLRLDPPELGRVDVRLDVSRDHRVTAVISADSPQVLSDLARGARDLQQALQSAGLDLADDGLRFDLSSNGQGNSFAQAQAQQDQPNFRAASAASAETPTAPETTASRPLSIDSWRGARVDLVA